MRIILSDEEKKERRKISLKKYAQKNKEKIKEYRKEYCQSEKYKKYHNEYQKGTKYKIKCIHRNRKYQKDLHKNNPNKSRIKANKQVELLNNNYITSKLKRKGFKLNEIKDNPEIIEVQRILIKTKRLCKTLQNLEKV